MRAAIVVVQGDVVASRRFVDEGALLVSLDAALVQTNASVPAPLPLTRSTRDQFHGVFAHLADAVEAALRLRLDLGLVALATHEGEDEPVDVRVGLGRGATGPTPSATSGPAWHLASDALRAAEDLPGRHGWPPSLRTVYRDEDEGAAGAVNAFLLCQDQLLARMDLRDRRALRGLLDGERQIDVATELGVTQPAVARRLRERGALAIHQGLRALRTTPPTTLTDRSPRSPR